MQTKNEYEEVCIRIIFEFHTIKIQNFLVLFLSFLYIMHLFFYTLFFSLLIFTYTLFLQNVFNLIQCFFLF